MMTPWAVVEIASTISSIISAWSFVQIISFPRRVDTQEVVMAGKEAEVDMSWLNSCSVEVGYDTLHNHHNVVADWLVWL